MARTIEYYKNLILNTYANGRAAAGLPVDDATQWSLVNIKRLWVWVVANIAFVLDSLLDVHKTNVAQEFAKKRPPSKQWYADLILNFQFGFPLIPGTHLFDNTGYTEAQIEASKVIKYVAVKRDINSYGRVRLKFKIAGSNGTDLTQIPATVVTALDAYLDTVAAAAGDNYVVEGKNYDKLKMKWKIFYDPLILDANGARLDGSESEPVKKAIKNFLKDKSAGGGMPFSGTYVLTFHIDYVQKVAGVVYPEIKEAAAQYGMFPFTSINSQYDADAGWLRFDVNSDLIIEYIPQQSI